MSYTHGELDSMPLDEELHLALAGEGYDEDDRNYIVPMVEKVIFRRLLGKDARWASMERDRRKGETTTY